MTVCHECRSAMSAGQEAYTLYSHCKGAHIHRKEGRYLATLLPMCQLTYFTSLPMALRIWYSCLPCEMGTRWSSEPRWISSGALICMGEGY